MDKKPTKKSNSEKGKEHVKKETVSKSHSKTKTKIIHGEKKSPNKGIIWTVTIAIILIAIVSAIFIFKPFDQIDFTKNSQNNQVKDEVLVSVNGENIMLSNLDSHWNALNPNVRIQMTRDQVLEQIIEETLLLQQAKELDLEVTMEEVDDFISSQIAINGLSIDDLEVTLESRGSSLDELRDIYQKQLSIVKLFDQETKDNLDVTDEEVEQYYNDNKEEFFIPEQVTVKHILIGINDEVNETTAYERMDEITALMNEDFSNYCDLVTEYSEDPGSIPTCGEYTFPRGRMVPEFENAAFDLEVGDSIVIRSSFGLHHILKIADVEPSYASLEQTRDFILQTLTESKAKKIYDEYITILKKKASIDYKTKEFKQTMNLEEFAKCLTDNGAVLFKSEIDCPHCNRQLAMFGDSAEFLSKVECHPNGQDSEKERCDAEKFEGYPTWQINGENFLGVQELEFLAEKTECQDFLG